MRDQSRSESRKQRLARLKANKSRRLLLENLESRELMAADLNYPEGAANDLTLVAQNNAGNLSLRLLRTDNLAQVASVTLEDAGDTTVNVKRAGTTAGEVDLSGDTLRIDLNTLSLLNTFVASAGGVLSINFEGGIEVPGISEDHLFLAATGSANLGFGLSVITTADINLANVNANFGGDLLLRSNPNSSSSGTSLEPDKVLSFPAAAVMISGGSLTANNITIEAKATKTLLVSADAELDGPISFAEVFVHSSADVSLQGAALTATGNLVVLAESNITTDIGRVPTDDSDPSDDDTTQDAAVALSQITGNVQVIVSSNSILNAGGSANVTSNNLVNAKSDANGTLGVSDAGGVTLAMTSVFGETVLQVDNATINAVGNIGLLANSIRTATTLATATPQGASDDGSSATTTRGETELAEEDARTSEGAVTLAAAIAIGIVDGNTSADLNNATITSTGGNISQQAIAKHTVVTKADGSSTADGDGAGGSDSQGKGIGVAVAIQRINADAQAQIQGTTNVDANNVLINSKMDGSSLVLDAVSGPTGAQSSGDVGFAGSLAIGTTVANARSLIADMASINANGSNLTLQSSGASTSTVRALPHLAASGKSLGVGASFALNIVDHTTIASIGTGAALAGVNNLTLSSTSSNTKTTETRAGAAGGIAFAGAISILVCNDDTLASINPGTSIATSGNVTLTANSNSAVDTKAQGDADGSEDAGFGMALALNYNNQVTDALISRNLNVGGGLTMLATSAGKSDVKSTASAKGGKKNSDSDGEDSGERAASARSAADSRASASEARTSTTTQPNPQASNSDGSISVAAAFAINLPEWETRARVTNNLTIDVNGQTQIRSLANHDAHTIADASATGSGPSGNGGSGGSDLGVGIAVALMSADITNLAMIGDSTLTTAGLILESGMRNLSGDQQHTLEAQATSGAGAAENSIAGSFALGVNVIRTQAVIDFEASVNAGGADMTVTATSDTSHKVHAVPNQDTAQGKDFGLGLSFAFAAVDEITEASVRENVTLINAQDVKLAAKSNSTKDLQARSGAAGDFALAGAVAILVDNEDTLARMDYGAHTLIGGHLEINADHQGTATVDADGEGQGGSDAGIGAAVTLAYIDENTEALLERSATVSGNLGLLSKSIGTSTANSTALASGAEEKDNETTDSKAQSQRNAANTGAQESGARPSSNTASNPSASTNSGGAIAVSAALAMNVTEAWSQAVIPNNLNVSVGGNTLIRSQADHDAQAIADSASVLSGGDLAVGVAVGLVRAQLVNEARIGGNTTLTTDGLTLEAIQPSATARHNFNAQATSGAGGGDNGIAGSVTVEIVHTYTKAIIAEGAQVNGLSNQPVVVRAVSNTTNTGVAKPGSQGAAASSFGVGGSFSLVRTEHFTRAAVEDDAQLSSGASQLTIEALADHDTTATAVNGVKNSQNSSGSNDDSDGSFNIGAAVALALVKNTTAARLGTGIGSTTVNGDVTVRAVHDHLITTTGDGNASGGETGIGVSFGLNHIDDKVSADIHRSLVLGGNLVNESLAHVISSVETKASATGASSEGNDSDAEASAQRKPASTNSGAVSNTGQGADLPQSSDKASDANTSASSQSGSSSGGVGVAASLAMNVYKVENKSTIGSGVTIQATGNARVSANGHFDAITKATGEAIADLTGDDTDVVAAGVGFSYAEVDSLATVSSDASIKATDITLEATTSSLNNEHESNDFVVWGIAGAGGTNDFAVAASVGLNIINLDLQAKSLDGSVLKASNNLNVQSEIELEPQTLAMTGALNTDGSAVGGALAFAEVTLASQASIGGHADAGNQLNVTAESDLNIKTLDADDLGDFHVDLQADLTTVAIAGAASNGSAGLAAAVSIDLFKIDTQATIGPNSQINKSADIVDLSMQKVSINSISNADITSLAGALGISTDGTSVGAGLQLEIVDKTTVASIGHGAAVAAKAGVDVEAFSTEKLINVAANAGVAENGLAFSAAVYVVDSDTLANVGDNAVITSSGDVSLKATGNFTATGVAGSVGAGSNNGVGASNVTLVHNDIVEAWVGADASVTAHGPNGLSVIANSQEDIIGLALAGAASGGTTVAGSAMVSVMTETTSARIQKGAQINAHNQGASGTPDVEVKANDTTNIISVAGSLAAGGGTSAGIGAEVSVLKKFTTAMIASDVTANVEGDIEVIATSVEDFTCVAAGLAIGGSNALAADAAVTILDVHTRAFIGDDPLDNDPSAEPGDVHARGNIIVDADNVTQIDKVVGVIGVSGSATGAAGVTVSTINKNTEAFIGQNAKVTADGLNSATSVRSGGFSIDHQGGGLTTNGIEATSAGGNSDPNDLRAQGEVGAPNVAPMKTSSGQNGRDGAVDGSNKAQRHVAPTMRTGFRGLSVTATNRDDIEVYNFALAAGGTAAIAISTGVSIVNNNTMAYISPGATINSNLDSAHDDQSVNVAASSDYSQIVIDGALAVAGTAAIAPAVGVALVDLNTHATISGNVKAKDDISVVAQGQEDVLLVGVGIGGGTVGAGAAANVIDFKTSTLAAIGSGAVVQADGDVLVSANDDSDVDVISGALGVGAVGLGAGVGVMMMTKDTQAIIKSGAIVDAKGNGDAGAVGTLTGQQTADGLGFEKTEIRGVIVQATSTDDYLHMSVVAGAGWVGVAGAVSISLIDSDTLATIGAGAKINQSSGNAGAHDAQSVYVNAGSIIHGFSFAGAVAGGVVGMAGAVDFGTMHNDAAATVESGAEITARRDVEVNSLSLKHVDGFSISGAGGFIGVSGSVSVWSMGSTLDRDYSTNGQDSHDPSSEEGSADQDAATKAEFGQTHGQQELKSFKKQGNESDNTSNSRVAQATNDTATQYGNRAPNKDSILNRLTQAVNVEPGTTAKVAAGSKIKAGRNINVNANEDARFTSTIGSVAGGAGAVGVAVSINSIATNATARAGGQLTAGGDINVTSNLDLDTDTLSFAGAGGIVAIGAAVVNTNDRSVSQAYIDNGTTITSADNVKVIAQDERLHKGETGQLAIGGFTGGGSFVEVNIDNPARAETSATIGDGVTIGTAANPVQSVKIEAKPELTVDVNTLGMSGGVGAATLNFAKSNVRPDTHALIGDATVYASGEVSMVARPDIHAEVTGTGVAVGAVATGLMLSSLEVGRGENIDEVQAGVENGATIKAKNIVIEADSHDYLDVKSVAGSGGAIAGVGASSSLTSDQSTLAIVGRGSSPLKTHVQADVFSLKADHRNNVDSQADAASFGLAAAAGGMLNNEIMSSSRVIVGEASIDARNLTINANNDLDKDRYGSGTGVNLATISASGVSASALASNTNIGTKDNPLASKIQITPGSQIRALGTTDVPGYLAIDATVNYDTTDRVNAEEYSAATGATLARGELKVTTATLIDVNSAKIENKYGEIYMTTRTNGLNSAHSDVTAASGVSSLIDAQVTANADVTQQIDITDATIVGRDVRLLAGMDRNRGTNILNNTATVQGFVGSFFPSMVLPKATSVLKESNTINIAGATEINAFGDIDLFAREGIGSDERALATGKIFSLSLMPMDVQASTFDSSTSHNNVEIDDAARLLAGAASTAIVQIVPVLFDGQPHKVGDQDVTLNAELDDSAKEALSIPLAMDYHYAPLNLGELTIDFYTGFVAKAVTGANAGGTVGHYYRFNPLTPDGGIPLLLHQEDFTNTSRWTNLGALSTTEVEALLADGKAVYESSVLTNFKAQMMNRFAVIKPVEMENARLVYRNVGNMLYAQRAELLDWMSQHSGDIEAQARYQAQLDSLDETMAELGLAKSITLDNGETALQYKQNLDTVFVEVPSILSSPGSIFIDVSLGGLPPQALVAKYAPQVTNTLLARAGTNVNLYNKTPFTMISEGAFIDDNQRVTFDADGNYLVLEPGNVYVNNTALTAPSDNGNQGITIMQDALGTMAQFNLTGLAIPLAVPNLDQDLYINGDVINEDGAVVIKNLEGSIFVNGEIRGETVELYAARDFNLNTDGWYHSNRDPQQYLNFTELQTSLYNDAEQARQTYGYWYNLPTIFEESNPADLSLGGITLEEAINQDVGKVLAQGDILITARYLNVNGLIQSGSDLIEFVVDSNFVAPGQNTNFTNEKGTDTIPGISYGDAGVPIDGYWDASRQAFVIEEIKPEGGQIKLVGQVLSTGNGRLQVANGFPTVNIDNNSPYQIIFEGIDTSTPREGLIEITDTSTTNPLVRTQYKFNSASNKIGKTLFHGTEIPNGGIAYQQVGSTVDYQADANLQYDTVPNRHYVWTKGQRSTEQKVITYVKDNSWYTDLLFFIEFDSTDISDVEIIPIDDEPTAISEVVQDSSGQYFASAAYTLKYIRTGNPEVELQPDKTLVRHPPFQANLTAIPPQFGLQPDTAIYKYIGPAESAVLGEEDYSDINRWQVVPSTVEELWEFDVKKPNQYDSNFLNRRVTLDGPHEIDGGDKSLLKKIVEQGKKDLYTHALRADYPIGIHFSHSPSSPQINIESKGAVLMVGNIKSPDVGEITITSTGGSIETDGSVAIYGASPTVFAGKDVKLNIEGNQGPLNVLAGGNIELNAISQDNTSSSFVVQSVVSLNGDVFINAKDGIYALNGNAKVTGDLVELLAASGEIGSDAQALRVESNKHNDGGLTALAEKDIAITQTNGDLILIRPLDQGNFASVESVVGNVTLTALNGSILDGDDEFIPKVNSPRSNLVQQFLNAGVLSGKWTASAFKYPVSAGMVKFLYPHATFLGQTPQTELTERVNVRGKQITLSAEATEQQIGHVGDAIIINDPNNFSQLSEEQQAILANANPTDVVGVAYGLYRYLGTDEANVDLTQEEFKDYNRWLKLETNFATGLNRTGEFSQLLTAGDRVRVENDVDHYGVYEYTGPTVGLNLLEINYLDRTRWIKLTGDAATDGGPVNLQHGMVILNKFVVDSLVLRPIRDLNVDAQDWVRSTAHYRTALEEVDALRIRRIESGDDTFLRARGDALDVGQRIEPAAIASAGEVVISALGDVAGLGDTQAMRTQIGPTGSLRILSSGGSDVTQVSDDTVLNGNAIDINNLRVDRIDAGGSVEVDVQQGNLIINHITSRGSVDLVAQNAILDAFPAHQGVYVNIHVAPGAVGGGVHMTANSIGTSNAPVTVQIETGDLVTATPGDQWLAAEDSLSATSLVSSSGNITVLAEDDVALGELQAAAGLITIKAKGSLTDRDDDPAADVVSVSTLLESAQGSIGTATNDIEIDTQDSANSYLSASALGDVRLVETSGRLNVNQGQSTGQGDVRLSTIDQPGPGQDIVAPASALLAAANGQVVLNAGDDVTIQGTINARHVAVYADLGQADSAGAGVAISGIVQADSAEINTGWAADTVSITSTTTPGWTIRTGDGDDTVLGSVANDFIEGGAGVDLLRGGAGHDHLNAGSGIGDFLGGDDGDDVLVGSNDGAESDSNFFDNVRMGDVLEGGNGEDTIYGLGGADLIHAGDGDDTVHAGDGSDLVLGGAGNDTLLADRGTADQIQGEAGDDFIVGSNTGNDQLLGQAGKDRILGQAGMDTIDGGDDDDWIDGGADTDVIFGGAGNDELHAGGGGDLVRGGEGDDVIYGSDDAGDTLAGEAGRDRIAGLSGNDTISGGAGDDILDGGAGDDLVEGDADSDLLLGGANHDQLYANNAANSGNDNAVNYLYGDFGTNGNEVGSGQDQLFGASGRDLLYGEAGDDRIDDDINVAGIPQPNASLDLIHYGADEAADATAFVNPVPTAPPTLLPPGPEYALSMPALPSGPADLGRWSELAGSASGQGLGPVNVTSQPSIATTATGAIVAWSDAHNGRSRIYVARYDGTTWQQVPGSTGPAVSDLAGQASNPSLIVTSSGQATVAWTQRTIAGSQIQLAQYDPTAAGGLGAWLPLGNSLATTGLSGTGGADHARLIETSFGLVVVWQENVAGTQQVYARRFDGNAWVAIGVGSDSAGGITSATPGSQLADVAVATSSGRIAVAWSQVDTGSGQRHVYMRQFDGTSWNAIAASATGLGISGALVTGNGSGQVSHSQPALAYLNDTLFVAWQQHQDNTSLVTLASIDLASSQATLIQQLATAHGAARPQLASNSSGLQVAWLAQPNRIFARQWNGNQFVEQIPGEASGQGINSSGSQFSGLSLSRDSQGNSSVAWLDQDQQQLQLKVRRQANSPLGSIYTASPNGQSIQQLLDNHLLTAGDVIVVEGVLAGDVTISAADAGVTIVGLPGAKMAGNVTILGSQVSLQRLDIEGNLLLNGANATLLRDNKVQGRIQIHGGTGSQVLHNQLASVDSAIVLSGNAHQTIVRHNTILQAMHGIVLGDPSGQLAGGSTNSLIKANQIVASDTGIRVAVASSANIVDNYVSAVTTGFDLDAPLVGSVAGNRLGNAQVGVRYEFPALLSDNTIEFNQIGVIATVNSTSAGLGFLPGLPNRIAHNQIGVQLSGRMQNQRITDNVIGVTGSGDLVSTDLDYANVIERNQVGTDIAGAIAYQKFAHNQVAIQAADSQSISYTVFNENALGVDIVGRSQVTLQYNTFYAAVGTHIQLTDGSQQVHVYHNTLWTEDGYNLYIADDRTIGFDSDHNVLHSSGNGKLVYWTKDFNDLLDWREDVAEFDLNSIGRTDINPTWSEPRFVNRAQGDFRMFDQVARQRLTSPAVGMGAYADQSNETTQPAYLELISPDLYEDWHRDIALPIRWSSHGNIAGSRIRIDLYSDTPTGPVWLANISTDADDTGEYLWRAADQLIPYGTTGLRIQISWVDNPSVLSRSTEAFTIPTLTTEYYVNDQSDTGDEFTGAKGNNRNTGTTASDPKPYPNNVLRNYTLKSGENVWVDAGSYPLLQTLMVSSVPNVGDDSKLVIRGASDGQTILTPANAVIAMPLVQIHGSQSVRVSDMVLNGGQHGILVDGASSAVELSGLDIGNNAIDGVSIAAGSAVDSISGSILAGNGRDGVHAAGSLGQLQGNTLYGNGGAGLWAVNADGSQVTGNVIHGNQTGIDLQGAAQIAENRIYNHSSVGLKASHADMKRNVIYSNNIGIQSEGSQLTNNLVYDNTASAVELLGASPSQLVNNTLHQASGSAIKATAGSGHTLMNNIVWAEGGQAIETTTAALANTNSDYNDYHLTGGAAMATLDGVTLVSLSAFQAQTGIDSHSYTFDPQFVNPSGTDGVLGYAGPDKDGRDDDFHLKSTAGSYHGGALAPVATDNGKGLPTTIGGTWTLDAVGSLAIDAGNPASSFGNEPTPNGNRVNLGAYGNTAQASKTVVPYLYMLSPNGGEAWNTGATLNILWNSDDLGSGTTYRLELFKAGAFVLSIQSAAPDTGSYAWTIPSFLISGNDYSIRVVRAGGALSDSSDTPFSIINTNQAPVLDSTYSFASIAEDAAPGLGNLVTEMLAGRLIDPDGPAAGIAIAAVDNSHGTWEYTLDGVSFSSITPQLIGDKLLLLAANASTRVRFVPAANYFGPANITYYAWDQADATLAGSAVQANQLQVNSLSTVASISSVVVEATNDTPVDIQLSNSSVKEKLAAGTVIGVFGSVDVDTGDTFTYQLVPGAGATDNNRFVIVGSELRLAAVLDYEAQPTHSVRVRTTDSQGASYEKVFTIEVTNAPIKVTGIYVRGSGWNTNYLTMLASQGLGSLSGGFRLVDGPSQLANSSIITWQNIDQLAVTFDENAVINPNALRVLNANNQDLAMAAGGYAYDPATRTARWTLNSSLTPGKFLISLEALMIQDGSLGYLDGEWSTSTATFARHGDSNPGGDLNFLFHYLPGDVTRNGQTNPGDVNLLRSVGTITPSVTNYWFDVTGNNQINPGDVNLVRSLGTVVLPSQTPTIPPPPRGGSPLTSAIGYRQPNEELNGGLTAAQLDEVRHQALAMWSAAGIAPEQLSRLQQTPILVSNFGSTPYLGMSYADRIEIDDDAAGWGWLTNRRNTRDSQLKACPAIATGMPAAEDSQSMDLLTVVLHEMGHQLGLEDLHEDSAAGQLMYWRLSPGETRTADMSKVNDQSLLAMIQETELSGTFEKI